MQREGLRILCSLSFKDTSLLVLLLGGDSSAIDQDPNIVFGEIIDKRNEFVFKKTSEALVSNEIVVLPWGALHLHGIETKLLKSGFKPIEYRRTRVLIDGVEMLKKKPK